MNILSWLFPFFEKPIRMTIAMDSNHDHLTHQECDGGAVRLIRHHFRKSTVTCDRCSAEAEFDSIYTQLFRFAKEDGMPRNITIVRWRDTPVKGRIHVIPSPPTMTIVINSLGFTHQECDGGAVTLKKETFKKSTATCCRCAIGTEFDSAYFQIFQLAKEDGKPRNFPFSRYRDRPIKGLLHVVPVPIA